MKCLRVFWAVALLLLLNCCARKTDNGLLCTGNSTGVYRPLGPGDSWHYETDTKANANYDSVIGQSNGCYYIRNYLPLNIVYDDTLRVASNGDIYIRGGSFQSEHLLVPVSPTVGQNWNYRDTAGQMYYETVLSTSATVVTSGCLYSNCLEIKDSLPDNLANVVYYAKGIGVVESNILNNDTVVSVAQLTSLILH